MSGYNYFKHISKTLHDMLRSLKITDFYFILKYISYRFNNRQDYSSLKL